MVFYFSTHSSGNQRRSIKCMVTEAVVASYETGNDVSRDTAQAAADAAQGATITTLQNNGFLPRKARYELPELQAAYLRSIA